jgi:hypothetical protein
MFAGEELATINGRRRILFSSSRPPSLSLFPIYFQPSIL